MASTAPSRKPSVDYFAESQEAANRSNLLSYGWDTSSFPDPVINFDSCDSIYRSPISPAAVGSPYLANSYALQSFSKADQSRGIKSEEVFDIGTFDDWMRWDDLSDAALSSESDFFPDSKEESVPRATTTLQTPFDAKSSSPVSSLKTEPKYLADFGDISMPDLLLQPPCAPSMSSPTVSSTPPLEQLYSTPLAWTEPTPGQRPQTYSLLSPEEEMTLRNIAMPPDTRKASITDSPCSVSSSEKFYRRSRNTTSNNRKRKSLTQMSDYDVVSDDEPHDRDTEDGEAEESVATAGSERRAPVKKTAHNMIEKRYRTNLNDKIATLRDSVPSLRVVGKKRGKEKGAGSRKGADSEDETMEDLHGLTPAHKLNKATVLSKATEYISHLEKRNRSLSKENGVLKSRVDAFEILAMARQPQAS